MSEPVVTDRSQWSDRADDGVWELGVGRWRGRLAGLPVLELPVDRRRPVVQGFRGGRVGVGLGGDVVEGLRGVARGEGATLFMGLLAVFVVLLRRYSGQDDVVVGSPVAGRSRVEAEGLVGLFVNTLVLRTDVSGDPTFRELLGRVRDVTLDALAHQDVPLERLAEELRLPRDPGRNPLFQALFVLQNLPFEDVLPGLGATANLVPEQGSSLVDLALVLVEGGGGVEGVVEFDSDLFDRVMVEGFVEHFGVLVGSVVADPDCRVSELEVLGVGERRLLLEEWCGSSGVVPGECLHELIEAQVGLAPEATAVVCGDGSLSYGELNVRANRLAHHLVGLGVGPGSLVGLCVDRGLDMVVGLLGILKAGGAYVPIDALLYPPDRIAFVLGDAQVGVVVTQRGLAGHVGSAGTVVCLDDPVQAAAIAGCPATNPVSGVGPGDLAYVIYTSGSTGTPKGVMIEHRGLTNLVDVAAEVLGAGQGRRVLQFAPVSFDISIGDVVLSLCHGATLHLAPVEALLSGEVLAGLLRDERVTHMSVAASVLDRVPEGWEFPDLTTVAVGAEVCPAATVERWAPGRRFFNAYGATETTILATFAECVAGGVGEPPIGRPVANMRVYVLDRDLALVPVGVPGELCVAGVGVARGYLGRPELTEQCFVPNPYGPPGDRLYRTGDRARWRRDGNLEFLGRVDDQVQLRGFRVELGEVEAALRAHPQVREAAVVAREDQPGDTRLVAYIATDQPAPTVTELRSHLSRRLPYYMVPNAYVALDHLPLTPTGKLDRPNLPPPTSDRPALGAPYTAPRTPTEHAIADAWAHILHINPIGIHDNFFELGGDSLLALRVVAHTAQTGHHITLKMVMEHQTVAELAAAAADTSPVAVDQGPVTGVVELTPIQRWYLGLGEPYDHGNMAVLLTLPSGLLSLEPLREAFRALVAHHDALRLRFTRRDDGAWAQAHRHPEEAEVAVEVRDLTGLAGPERTAAIEAACAELQASLDIADGPIVRVALMELGDEARLFIVVHHLVVDVLSLHILFEDFETAYRSAALGEPVILPRKTTSFQHWAQRVREHAPEVLRREADFWIAQKPSRPMRVDFVDGENSGTSERRLVRKLSAQDTAALLHEVNPVLGTQTKHVLLTALAQVLHAWSPETVIWLETHGRDEQIADDLDLSRTFGWFTSIFPLLLHVDETMGDGAALEAVMAQLEAVPGLGVGYGVLQSYGPPEVRAQLPTPLEGGINFNYVGRFDTVGGAGAPMALADESPGPMMGARDVRPTTLYLTADVLVDSLSCEWVYSENLHRPSTIEALADAYLERVRGLIRYGLEKGA